MQAQEVAIEEVTRHVRSLFAQRGRAYNREDDQAIRQVLRQIPEFVGRQTIVAGYTTSTDYFNDAAEVVATGLSLGWSLQRILGRIYRNATRRVLTTRGYQEGDPQWELAEVGDSPLTVDFARPSFLEALSLPHHPQRQQRLPARPVGPLPHEAAEQLEAAIFAPGSELPFQIESYKIDWRRLLYDTARNLPGLDTETLVLTVLELIRAEIQTRAAESNRARRDADDALSLQRGLLTPKCNQWTYEELEHWARWASRDLPTRLLEGWIVDNAETTVELTNTPEVLLQLIRSAPKRALCTLLALAGSSAPDVSGRESFKWYNLRLTPTYLTPDLIERLRTELPPRLTIPLLEVEAGTVIPSRVSERNRPLAVAVATDLHRNRPGAFNGSVLLSLLDLEVGRVYPRDPRSTVVVVGLSGQTLVSTVATAGLTVSPLRVLVEAGDVLVVDEGAQYDFLVLRAHEQLSSVALLEWIPQ